MAVKICDAPGKRIADAGVNPDNVPVAAEPLKVGPASKGTTFVKLTLPVLVTV